MRIMSPMRSLLRLLILFNLVYWSPPFVMALDMDEKALKAVYLYNFAKYTKFPSNAFKSPDSPFTLCVAGAQEVADALAQARNRVIGSHIVDVVSLDNTAGLPDCKIIYLGPRAGSRIAAQRNAITSALFVSDDPNIGAITFVRSGENRGFALDLNRAKDANLSFSSELIKLAVSVSGAVKDAAP
jgi:YfiR/HmsC-like